MSSSRPGRTRLTSSARRIRSSVVLPMALTTTTTSLPAGVSEPRGRRRHGSARRRRPTCRRTSARRGSRRQASAAWEMGQAWLGACLGGDLGPDGSTGPRPRVGSEGPGGARTKGGCTLPCGFGSVSLRANRQEGAAASRTGTEAGRHPKDAAKRRRNVRRGIGLVIVAAVIVGIVFLSTGARRRRRPPRPQPPNRARRRRARSRPRRPSR